MEEYENSVISEVEEFILFDSYNKKEEILDLIKKILSSQKYFESIKADFDKILEDKKINSKDISKMMIVVMKLNNILPKLLNIKEKISIDKIKYIFYATLYLYIIKYQKEFLNDIGIDEFRLLYSSLWNLIEINPEIVKVSIKKISGFCCCDIVEVKESK
jgi:hypothetical protein